jgi:DNA gyrase subunit A
MRVDDVPATTGHGKPLSSFFALPDGAKLVGVIAHDKRRLAGLPPDPSPAPDDPPAPHVVAVTRGGRVVRIGVELFVEPSNRNGRLYARLEDGDAVLAAHVSGGGETVLLATRATHVLAFPVREANCLKGAGKGVTAVKLAKGDEVIAFELGREKGQGPEITLSTGRTFTVTPGAAEGPRAGKGRQLLKRGSAEPPARSPRVAVDPAKAEAAPSGAQAALFDVPEGEE